MNPQVHQLIIRLLLSLQKHGVIIMLMMHEFQMRATGPIFIVETLNFQTLFPTP